MQVLIIEDDEQLNRQLSGLLSDSGCSHIPARSEQEAESILQTQGASITVALVDMFLPAKAQNLNSKESGLRLIRLMAKRYPHIVPVVFTGHGDLSNASSCMEAGAF